MFVVVCDGDSDFIIWFDIILVYLVYYAPEYECYEPLDWCVGAGSVGYDLLISDDDLYRDVLRIICFHLWLPVMIIHFRFIDV